MLDLLTQIDKRTSALGKFLPEPKRRVANVNRPKPQPGPQEAFLAADADIVIYGGAAGGGKTWGLLVDPLKYMDVPGFGAVIFRRSYPQITNEGGLWDESVKIYPTQGLEPRQGSLDWTAGNGNRVAFKHLQYEKSVQDWLGAQVPYIGWDQLELFTEKQFFYMLSRNRSTCGVHPRMRATVNPDAESWVAELIVWWIDQDTGYPIEERSGVVRWFIRKENELIWGESARQLIDDYGNPELPVFHEDQPVGPKSLTFIPAKLEDNQILMKADPGYLRNLLSQPLVDQERLLRGNWKIKPEAGKIFNRAWFEIIEPEAVPAGGRQCRFWDLAASEKKIKGPDPDYSASCLIKRVGGEYFLLDATAEQMSPDDTDRAIVNLARQDGKGTKVVWEQEGGASGVRDSAHLVKLLNGWDAQGRRPKGDKIVRAKGLASQSRAGNVKVVRGAWNRRWLTHMHGQPDLPHDDEMDAASGCYNELTFGDDQKRPRSASHSATRRR